MAERSVELPPGERESVMPVSEFLHGLRFDPETKRAMGIAFKMTCAAFGLTPPM